MPATEASRAATPRVSVSDDRLTVALSITGPNPAEGADPAVVLVRLADARIPVDEQLKARVGALVDASGRIKLDQPLLICQGTKPVHDVAPHLELLATKPDTNEAASYYDRSQIMMVQAGQPIARIVSPVEGRDGIDVFGHPIRRRRAKTDPPKLGRNVQLDADGVTVKATAAGSLHFEERSVCVETVLQLAGNVDFSTGNIDFAGDLMIAGTIADLFKVKGNTIVVRGAVEAADVYAEKDLEVAGGIVGKEKGRCRAGHNITAKYIANAHIQAGNHVIAQTEIANCRITCGGVLTVERGPLLAGHAAANGGMSLRTLGSPACVQTIVEAGVDRAFLEATQAKLTEIENQQNRIKRTREIVGPLMANPKNLTPTQKEKATELLFETDDLETRVKAALVELRSNYETVTSRCRPEIEVADAIHPGVTLSFPGLEATVQKLLKGPVKIVPREIDGAWRIVAVNTATSSLYKLDTHAVKNETIDALRRALTQLDDKKDEQPPPK